MALPVQSNTNMTDPTVTRSAFNQSIANGLVFTSADYFTVAANSTKYILMDISPLGAGNYIIFRVPVFSSTGGPVHVDFFGGTDYSGGTALIVNNRYQGKPDALSLLNIDPTGTDEGTKLKGILLPGSTEKQSTSAGIAGDDTPSIYTADQSLLIKFDNTDNEIIEIGYEFTWLELVQ